MMESIGSATDTLTYELPKTANHCFLIWEKKTHTIRPVSKNTLLPIALISDPNQRWPDQLTSNAATAIMAALQSETPTTIELQLSDLLWRLNVTPTESSHSLLFVELLTIPQHNHALSVLELAKSIDGFTGIERNKQLLERLADLTQADRIIVWQLQQEEMIPLYINTDETIERQMADRRFIRALQSRKQLSFSDLFHQPLLKTQAYIKQSNMLARLDSALNSNGNLFGFLSLEFRQVQTEFSPDLFLLAETAATLLLKNELQDMRDQLSLPLENS